MVMTVITNVVGGDMAVRVKWLVGSTVLASREGGWPLPWRWRWWVGRPAAPQGHRGK